MNNQEMVVWQRRNHPSPEPQKVHADVKAILRAASAHGANSKQAKAARQR